MKYVSFNLTIPLIKIKIKKIRVAVLNNKSPLNLIIALVGCFIMAVMLFKASHYKLALQTKHWPYTTGTIIQSQLYHVNPNSIHDSYRPDVSYSYQVNGVNYQGKTVFKGDKIYGIQRERLCSKKLFTNFPLEKLFGFITLLFRPRMLS